MSKSYNVFLRSYYRTSGTSNNAYYNIPWETILPPEYSLFSVKCRFISEDFVFDNTIDDRTCEVRIDIGAGTRTYDTKTNSTNLLIHHTYINGTYTKTSITGTASTTVWGCYSDIYDSPNHIVYRPREQIINVKLIEFNTTLGQGTLDTLLTINSLSASPDYSLILEFTPIEENKLIQ